MGRNFLFALLALALSASADELPYGQRPGSPLDHLPGDIRQVNGWGQRADFSHDGKRILFLEKTFGDVYELTLATGELRPLTHHYYHSGYTRALYLANGDILLSGSRTFDPDNPNRSRFQTAELWVLDKSLSKPPVALGTYCSEGPAVSRTSMKIAWVTNQGQYPDYEDDEYRVNVGEIGYHDGVPALGNRRVVMRNVDNPQFSAPTPIETQNFIPPDESRITLSLYRFLPPHEHGAQVAILDLASGRFQRLSDLAGHHNEPEGIFPDGKHTTVESTRQFAAWDFNPEDQYIDIWKLSLDGKGDWERLTHFTNYAGFKATNPVVSDDGRYMAFQMAKLGDPAGVGRGLFIMDLAARAQALAGVCARDVLPLEPGLTAAQATATERQTVYGDPAVPLLWNVTHPTLTAYLPDPARATGTAVIVAPGGAWIMLAMKHEGTDVAEWLAAHGIAAFVLKYRTAPMPESVEGFKAERDRQMREPELLDPIIAGQAPISAEDGRAAVKFLREHAERWGIDPARIGILGFSAGGGVVRAAASEYTPAERPDFAATIYGAGDVASVPDDAPPIFILAAADDDSVPVTSSTALFARWRAADRPAALHVYATGGHGFGMLQRDTPTDDWIEVFYTWLKSQGLD
ncbi:MAG: dienelactone hydrolase family protein [Woeseiaceae bacterium]